MKQRNQESEYPLVLGGQGRSPQSVVDSGRAITLPLLFGLLALGVVCLL